MLELLEEDAVAGDLAERLAVGAAADRHPDRAARAVARQADDAHVVAEVLAAELRADAGLLREREHLLLELDVAEPVTGRPSRTSAASRGTRALASFAVSTAISADVPPMTTARWYGGHAAVPSVFIFSNSHGSSVFSLSSALVSWNR